MILREFFFHFDLILFFLIICWVEYVSPQNLLIKPVAGYGGIGFSGDNGAATSALFRGGEAGGWTDTLGNVYICDHGNARIRKVNTNGIISTFGGTGVSGNSGNSGLFINETEFTAPYAIAGGPHHTFYFSDSFLIWKYNFTSHRIFVYAGTTPSDFSGDDGPATSAGINTPLGLWVTSGGVLYFADSGNNRIRKILPNNIISTIAGNGTFGYSGDESFATVAMLKTPSSVYVDTNGEIFIVDSGNHIVRSIDSSNIIHLFAGTPGFGSYSGDGNPASSATLNNPKDIKGDLTGNIYIADTNNCVIRAVDPSKTITTVFGTNGQCRLSMNPLPVGSAYLGKPTGLWLDTNYNLYLMESSSIVRFIVDSPSFAPTISPTSTPGDTLTVSLFVGGNGNCDGLGDYGPASAATLGIGNGGVWVDSLGNVYIPEEATYVIRKVNTSNIITRIGGTGNNAIDGTANSLTSVNFNTPYTIVGDPNPAREFFIVNDKAFIWKYNFSTDSISVIAGDGSNGFNGDYGPATSAQLDAPEGMWVTTTGDIYIAVNFNNKVRKVSNGIITAVAGTGEDGFSGDGGKATSATLSHPGGVYVDTTGKMFIADASNNRIRVVYPNGIISTYAGNGNAIYNGDNIPATMAGIATPLDMKGDSLGNLYIADQSNSRVRMVNPSGIIFTFIGSGVHEDYPASSSFPVHSEFPSPMKLWIDSNAQMFINVPCYLYKVSLPFFNTSVWVNYRSELDMKVIAGSGKGGFGGDSGPATSAKISAMIPYVDTAGNVYIPDSYNARVRKVDTNGIITSFMGSVGGSSGLTNERTKVALSFPYSIVGDQTGTFLYLSDSIYIWQYSFSTNNMSVVVGVEASGFSGDNGPALFAQLNSPSGIWLTTSNDLYIADTVNNRIEKLWEVSLLQ